MLIWKMFLCIRMEVEPVKNSTLYKVYLERLIPFIGVCVASVFLLISGPDSFYDNNGAVFIPFVMIVATAIMFFFIRRTGEAEFVNGLPVTKEQQWKCLYYSLATMVGIVYTVYVMTVTMHCFGSGVDFGEILLSGVVKAATAMLCITILLWILGHTDFYVQIIILLAIIIFWACVWSPKLGTFIQKAFNTGGNNFVYELTEIWNIMTVPLSLFSDIAEVFDFSIDMPNINAGFKFATTGIYMVIVVVLTIVLYICSKNNYSKLPLEKKFNRGWIVGFPKVITAMFFALYFMTIMSVVVEYVENVSVSVTTHDEYIEVEKEHESYSYLDRTRYSMFKNGKKICEGYIYSDVCEIYEYEIYDVTFPKEYLYGFIGAMVISVGLGIGFSVVLDKSIKKEGGRE